MDRKLAQILNTLKGVPEEKWDRYILRQDMFYRHYTEEMCGGIICRSRQTGKKKAGEILGGDTAPEYLIRKNGLEVRIAEDEEFLMPDSVNFAEYHDGRIRISKKLLTALDRNSEALRSVLGSFRPYDILFFHELYHYYEETEEGLENAGISYKIRLMPFINKRISPESAGEIAAYEFTKQVNNISFHPYILGIAGLYVYEPEMAEEIVSDIT